MKVIYICGAYRARNEWAIGENIAAAEYAAAVLWKAGYATLCPHKNTARMGGVVEDQVFLDGDIEMMLRCDAVVKLANWSTSVGAREEIRIAKAANMSIFDFEPGDGLWAALANIPQRGRG